MEAFAKLLGAIAWPCAIVFLILWGSKHFPKLLPLIENIKYKDVEIKFRQQLESARQDVGEEVIDEEQGKLDPEMNKLIEASPSAAIMQSWVEVESAAKRKIRQLVIDENKQGKLLRSPIDYLVQSGAFIGSTVGALHEMRAMRNQVAHSEKFNISIGAAFEYAILASAIIRQIDSIDSLPKVRLRALTLFVLEINHLMDIGKYFDITIDEVYDHINRGDIFVFLIERTRGDSDFSIFSEDGPYQDFIEYLNDKLKSMYNAYGGDHRRKWGIENYGLCLLLAWTNEIIQQGVGWIPRDK